MKVTAISACSSALLLASTSAFVSQHVLLRHKLPTPSSATAAAAAPSGPHEAAFRRMPSTRAATTLSGDGSRQNSRGVRRSRGSRNRDMLMSTFDAAGDAAARAFPTGPGAGVIDLKFQNLKAGGFKVYILLFLLGQARAADNDSPFSVRDTEAGIRVLIGDESKNDSQWEGVLDLSWGVEPRPFFRVDRIDPNEVYPYPGELYILNKLVDAIIDVNGEQSVEDYSKLFMFREGEQNQLAETKATLASMAALG